MVLVVKRWLIFALGTFLAVPANSGTADPVNKVLIEAVNQGEFLKQNKRTELAYLMVDYWEDLQKRVPTVSPIERDWVESELERSKVDDNRNNSADRVYSSEEYALWHIEDIINYCLRSLNILIDDLLVESRRDFEMYNWLSVVRCYSDSDGLYKDLKQAGLIDLADPNRIFVPMSKGTVDILVRFVVTGAMSDTMNWKIVND